MLLLLCCIVYYNLVYLSRYLQENLIDKLAGLDALVALDTLNVNQVCS